MMASKLVIYQRGEEAAVFPADGLLEVLNLSRTSVVTLTLVSPGRLFREFRPPTWSR